MSKKKSNKFIEEENELYASVKNYVHQKTKIDYNYIEVLTATRIHKDSFDIWENFSILFKDLSTKKIFRLENEELIEEDA